MRSITPKTLVIELLNVADNNSISVKDFIGVGELFGFQPNAIRVCLARLAKDFIIESDERGYYRLNREHSPIYSWVSEWRLGLRRMRKWDGRWLALHFAGESSAKRREQSLKILDPFYNFKEGLPGLWVRPNNLRKNIAEVRESLFALGLSRSAELFIAGDFKSDLLSHWKNNLWPVDALAKKYSQLISDLQKSYQKCQKMPLEKAMVEAFVLGGETIRTLARDPLLPEEIMPSDKFAKLTQSMIDYDRMGRGFWAQWLEQIPLIASPAHLALASA